MGRLRSWWRLRLASRTKLLRDLAGARADIAMYCRQLQYMYEQESHDRTVAGLRRQLYATTDELEVVRYRAERSAEKHRRATQHLARLAAARCLPESAEAEAARHADVERRGGR